MWPTVYVYTRDSSWNPNCNILGPYQLQYNGPVASAIAQQYSSTTFISLCFNSHKEKYGVHYKSIVSISLFKKLYNLKFAYLEIALRSSHGLIEGIVLLFAWRGWERMHESLVMSVGLDLILELPKCLVDCAMLWQIVILQKSYHIKYTRWMIHLIALHWPPCVCSTKVRSNIMNLCRINLLLSGERVIITGWVMAPTIMFEDHVKLLLSRERKLFPLLQVTGIRIWDVSWHCLRSCFVISPSYFIFCLLYLCMPTYIETFLIVKLNWRSACYPSV